MNLARTADLYTPFIQRQHFYVNSTYFRLLCYFISLVFVSQTKRGAHHVYCSEFFPFTGLTVQPDITERHRDHQITFTNPTTINRDFHMIFTHAISLCILSISQCSADNRYHRHITEHQQVDDDNVTIVKSDDQNASNIVTADDDSNQLQNNANVPTSVCSEANDSSYNNNNRNNINANASSEIDGEPTEDSLSSMAAAPLSPPPNVSAAFRRTASVGSAPSTSDGNDNPTLKQWQRRLRTPVWARSLTLHTFLSKNLQQNKTLSLRRKQFSCTQKSTKHSGEIRCTQLTLSLSPYSLFIRTYIWYT